MASAKRKRDTEDASVQKRPRAEQSDYQSKEDGKSTKVIERPATKPRKDEAKSVLKKEQQPFPRGGADLLTPIERKQINAKALRDVAAEQHGLGDLFDSNNDHREGPNDDSGVDGDAPDRQSKKQKKRNSKHEKDDTLTARSKPIGGLSYKRIVAGSLILGQVISISTRELTIALPNNLVGYTPLTSISKQLNSKIQRLLEQDPSAADADGQEAEAEDISLQDYFQVGQFLRASVTSTSQDQDASGKASRKRLELSIEPASVNVGLNKTALVEGAVVQASVASVEDHGLVVDLDLEDFKIQGFIPTSSLPESTPISFIKEGTVLICQVTHVGSKSKVVKLSADSSKYSSLKTAPSVDAFLPGVLTDILLTEVHDSAARGKIMGMLDATVDLVHSRSFLDSESFDRRFKVGKKIKGRIIYNFPTSDDTTVGFSVLGNLLHLDARSAISQDSHKLLSSTISNARVIQVDPRMGVYLDLGSERSAFAHISRLADKRIDSISAVSGPYKVDSQHRARVLDYNSVDDLYTVSLQESILNQSFLRIEDVPIGEVVNATITKILIGPAGIKGLLITLAESIVGFVPDIHLSDVILQHPERKFREGGSVKARVLSTDLVKRQIKLTLKKTLVNSDSNLWKAYDHIEVGDSSLGTLVKVDANGALAQFYGSVKGFLPVSEMSEAYIKDAREHFRIGQVLTVNAISVDSDDSRLTLSCRETKTLSQSTEAILSSLKPGSLTSGVVFEKSQDDIQLRLDGSDAIARLTVDHVSDGSLKKRQSALTKIRVGQKLDDVLILDVHAKRRLVVLSNRSSLIKAAKDGRLLTDFEKLKTGLRVTGFVSNITSDGVFVSFVSKIIGLITPRNVAIGDEEKEDFGLSRLQVVTAVVRSIDYKGATPRFWLTLRDDPEGNRRIEDAIQAPEAQSRTLSDPVDDTLNLESELAVDKITKARIVSVKDTQLNVELAKDVQGRVDVSEIFDRWEDIKDRKRPLRQFNQGQILDVRVLGAHDTRNHRFLPISHRTGKNTVYELTAKPSVVRATDGASVQYADLKVGNSCVAFVNNIASDCLWVSISPVVRGRVKAVDVSDDLSLASDLPTNFPPGSALRVRVLSVDAEKARLDLTARSGDPSVGLALKDISKGMILPGRVTKISDRQIIVQLSESIVGVVDLIDMADDYSQSDPAKHQKNDLVRVCVIQVDVPNKKIFLSLRPSRVLSSSIKVIDREITSIDQLHVNDIYSGFIRNIDHKGIFITLGHGITAFVRVSHLSDSYLKEWKDGFQRDQLVKGKIISVDKASGHIQMSLKGSIIQSQYTAPVSFNDLEVGDIVTGKVAKVETFGVFIVVDNSEKVRGLCHRSEIAEQRIEDATSLFSEGDVVKAKVLKVDPAQRRVNFGMKASYFGDLEEQDDLDSDGDVDSEGGAAVEDLAAEEDDMEQDILANGGEDSDEGLDISDDDQAHSEEPPRLSTGLKVGGFDWFGLSTSESATKPKRAAPGTLDDESGESKKKRRKRAEIQVDRTGDLDANGPQSVDDFERLLLGEPDSSLLWLQYMAFHLEMGEVDQSRQIGERALKSIGLGQDAEKMNVWVAMLNLENAYGDEDTIEAVFRRACEYNDAEEIYSRLASIYVQSGKKERADDMFQRMLKKFTQDPKVWVNYGTFLFDTAGDAEKGREVLPRALQVLPKFIHLDVTSKFAQLEFKSGSGLPERGRTIFEGLISSFPKRVDLYNVLVDMEMKLGNQTQIRALFERIFDGKLKPKQAKYFFKRWLAFEEAAGDERRVEDVKARAATWIRGAGQVESS